MCVPSHAVFRYPLKVMCAASFLVFTESRYRFCLDGNETPMISYDHATSRALWPVKRGLLVDFFLTSDSALKSCGKGS